MSKLPPEFQALPYRPCAGLLLLNADKDIFVGERIDMPGSWQMPQGGIDLGEEIEKAAMRELYEEAGISDNHARILKVSDTTYCYDLPAHRIPTFWNGRYRGQEQRWIALEFLGQDSDIILDAHSEPEFERWKWARQDEILDLIVPFKRSLYEKVFEDFKELL